MGGRQKLIKQLSSVVRDEVSYMTSRNIIPDGAEMGYKTKFLPKLLYRTKHGNLTKQQLSKVDLT